MLRHHLGNDAEMLKEISNMNAFKRLVIPDEIASTLYFAATNPAIIGSVLHANLGQIEN